MDQQRYDVFIVDDEGDDSFAKGAPEIIEALGLISSTRAFQFSMNVALRESELSSVQDLHYVYSVARDELRELHTMMAPYLDSVFSLMSSLRSVNRSDTQNLRSKSDLTYLLRCQDGLIIPFYLTLDSFLLMQSVFNYDTFRAQFARLCQVVASGVLFSACEPRIKVLQGRFCLYRAFNSSREDTLHQTFGGGSISSAPQLDTRRIGSCVSSTTLINFIQKMLETEPNILLPTRSALLSSKPQAASKVYFSGKHGVDSDVDNINDLGDEKKERDQTLKEVVDCLFASLPLRERCFTPGVLGLIPDYTERTQRTTGISDDDNTTKSQNAHVAQFLQHFLDVFSGNKGGLLARLVMPLLTKIVTKANSRLELEFTISGYIPGEVQYIASWCVRTGLIALGKTQFSLRIVQKPLKDTSSGSSAMTMEDVLMNIFGPIWLTLLQPEENSDMVLFLQELVSVVVFVSGEAELQDLPAVNDVKMYSAKTGVLPPDAFFIYHIWRNVQLINSVAAAHCFFASNANKGDAIASNTMKEGDSSIYHYFLTEHSPFLQHYPIIKHPISFRLHLLSASKNSFLGSVMGLLVADVVVNPLEVFSWSPLAYLYYLTQRSILLIPSCIHSAPIESALRKSVPFVLETGLNAYIASLDPLYSVTSDDALCEELNGVQKGYQLSIADVTEFCLHSTEHANWGAKKRYDTLGDPWKRVRADYNNFKKTQVSSLRLRFREMCLAHEMDLVCWKGLNKRTGAVMKDNKQNADMTEMLWQTLQRYAFNDASCRSSMQSSSYAMQREIIWRFFDIPSHIAVENVDSDVLRKNFSEKQIVCPRIVLLGPKVVPKNDVAQKLVKALHSREYYMSFSVHYEPVQSDEFQITDVLRQWPTSPQKEIVGKQVLSLLNASCLPHPSFKSFFKHKQDIHIPDKFCVKNGVWDVDIGLDANDATKTYFRPLPTWQQFQCDVRQLRGLSSEQAVQLYAKKRLEMLECKFNLHVALTDDDQSHIKENISSLSESGDLYKCTKVDVHCHMAAGMTAKELLSFIKDKLQSHSSDVVSVEHGTNRLVTLGETFTDLRLTTSGSTTLNFDELTVASLKVKAEKCIFNRFDRFNGRYNPLGNSALRSIFLKTDNVMCGRYFAELIKKVFRRQAEDRNTFSEYRLSIYGRCREEWGRLAHWVVQHRMVHSTNRWMVQVPRLYHIYRKAGIISSFGELLANVFVPLWEASINPSKHQFLSYFLSHVSGFDSVDNESEREADVLIKTPPEKWTSTENPSFSYWTYYMWANITALNRYRAARGMSTFSFRPHAGESGDPDHMADVFFVADGVNHGINLSVLPVLQYLYYLAQIPLGITPLSNNALFCKYSANPFPTFFRRGLNVTLATDGALTFHYTEQPLIEEYSTAANFWNLSLVDLCEIAKNSVLMSGFHSHRKKKWLGSLYALRSCAGNDVCLSNVPHTRCTFRYETYMDELNCLHERTAMSIPAHFVLSVDLEDLYVIDVVGLTRNEVIKRRLNRQQVLVSNAAAEKTQEDTHAVVKKPNCCVTALSQL